jgi:hypothetical protein
LNSCHYRPGGAGVVYFEHDALFREAGWDTAFFAMHRPRNVPGGWAGLQAAIRRMRDLPAREVAAMGAGAPRFVAERFTPELYCECMLDLHASLGVAVERRGTLN